MRKEDSPQIRRIEINDVFAPSFAEVGAGDVEELSSPRTRLILHNWHLTSTILPNALSACSQMGCDPVAPSLSLAAKTESSNFLERAVADAAALSENFEESSVEWLCLKIYVHFCFVARNLQDQEPPLSQLTDHILVLGATCRELELAIKHRKTVEDRKKTNDRLASNSAGRNGVNAERVALAEQRIAHAQFITDQITEKKLSNRALARVIIARWNSYGEKATNPAPPSSTRTVENWLTQQKVTRTYPSA